MGLATRLSQHLRPLSKLVLIFYLAGCVPVWTAIDYHAYSPTPYGHTVRTLPNSLSSSLPDSIQPRSEGILSITTPPQSGMAATTEPLAKFNSLIGMETRLLANNWVMTRFFSWPEKSLKDRFKTNMQDHGNAFFGINRAVERTIPYKTFTRPYSGAIALAVQLKLTHFCDSGCDASPFSGSGFFRLDFETDTASLSNIDLQNLKSHRLTGRMVFSTAEMINSLFLDENADFYFRLDDGSERRWRAQIGGALGLTPTPNVTGVFGASSGHNGTGLIGQFSSQ